MAELYDSAADDYYAYGSVDQYLKEHPEMYLEGFLSLVSSEDSDFQEKP